MLILPHVVMFKYIYKPIRILKLSLVEQMWCLLVCTRNPAVKFKFVIPKAKKARLHSPDSQLQLSLLELFEYISGHGVSKIA